MKIFSGDDSMEMWDLINNAKTKKQLRWALYVVCCRIQELEGKMDVPYISIENWDAAYRKWMDVNSNLRKEIDRLNEIHRAAIVAKQAIEEHVNAPFNFSKNGLNAALNALEKAGVE